MQAKTVCRVCGESFVLLPNKPGFANVCIECTTGDPVEKVMATVAWSGKHTVEIEITTAAKAKAFNAANRRFGPDPGLRFSSQAPINMQAGERDNLPTVGATYRTRLGEARRVK